jgi:hypothetical protein
MSKQAQKEFNDSVIEVLEERVRDAYKKWLKLRDDLMVANHEMNGLKLELYLAKGIKEHHDCPYCSLNVVAGDNIDELCNHCARSFGHKYYSEL